jgi:hypothetical protein
MTDTNIVEFHPNFTAPDGLKLGLTYYSDDPSALWDEFQASSWILKQGGEAVRDPADDVALQQMLTIHLGAFDDAEPSMYPNNNPLLPVADSPSRWRIADVRDLYNACRVFAVDVLSLAGIADMDRRVAVIERAEKTFMKKAAPIIGK